MSDVPITRETLSDMCDRLIRNSILLRTVRLAEGETIPVGATKFGGMPDVPEGFQWPVGVLPGIPGERPPGTWAKTFVFQVNCAQVAVYDEDKVLPPKGMFYFFYDDENYAPEVVFVAEDESLAPCAFPEGAQPPEKCRLIKWILSWKNSCLITAIWPVSQDFRRLTGICTKKS